jgi:hypothetical protein
MRNALLVGVSAVVAVVLFYALAAALTSGLSDDSGRSDQTAYMAAVRVVEVPPGPTPSEKDRVVATQTPARYTYIDGIYRRIEESSGGLLAAAPPGVPVRGDDEEAAGDGAPAGDDDSLGTDGSVSDEIVSIICDPAAYSWNCDWAIATILCESGADPFSISPSGIYFGLWQIDYHFPGWDDPRINSNAAWGKYQNNGTNPWPVCGQ